MEFIYPLTASISCDIVDNIDESISELCPIVWLSSFSIAFSPSVAGLMIASKVVKDLINI